MMAQAKTFVVSGRTAVITGAGSGIGRALAHVLARRGCHLALADIDAAGLAQTVAAIHLEGVRISSHVLDVADRAAVSAFPEAVREAHGPAQILINNAGVALGGTFTQVSEADFDWLIAINFQGVVRMTRVFLPMLLGAPEARLVNLSSLYGLIAPPGQTAYCASKFAVRGFSESLRHELGRTPVGVTVVHPGGVATAIADNARIGEGVPPAALARMAKLKAMLTLAPEAAAEQIVRGVERRRPRVIVGRDARFAMMVERLRPTGYWPILERLAARKVAA